MDEIKAIRLKVGMTQERFAGYLGVAQARVSEWETGRHKPHWRTLAAAHRLLKQHEDGTLPAEPPSNEAAA